MSTSCTVGNLDELLGPALTADQARDIYRQGEEAVVLSLLKMAGKLAALSPAKPAPTAPSGTVPPYQKPPARKSRKMPGAKPGKHPLADCRGLQRPPADETHRGRPDPTLTTLAGGPVPLVRTDSPGSPGIGRAARRRNVVASGRHDPLAVGLRQRRSDVLPHRPLAGRTGLVAILHRGIPGNAGQRLLGSVPRRAVRGPTSPRDCGV